jgi:hypothetical protein
VTPDVAMVGFARSNGLLAADEAGAWTPLTGGVSPTSGIGARVPAMSASSGHWPN